MLSGIISELQPTRYILPLVIMLQKELKLEVILTQQPTLSAT